MIEIPIHRYKAIEAERERYGRVYGGCEALLQMEENEADGTKTKRVHRLRKPLLYRRTKNTSTRLHDAIQNREKSQHCEKHSRVILP